MSCNKARRIARAVSLSADTFGKSVKYYNIARYTSYQTETKNGVTFTNNADGSWTITGTATADTTKSLVNIGIPTNHVLSLSGCVGGSSSTYYLYDENRTAAVDTGSGYLYTYTYTWSTAIVIMVKSGVTMSITLWPLVLDLTLLYGATLEPTTLADFHKTDLGKLVHNGTYLAYTGTDGAIYDARTGLGYNGNNLFNLNADTTGKQYVTITGTPDNLTFTSTASYGRCGYKVSGLVVGTSYTATATVTKRGTTSSSVQFNKTTEWGGSIGLLFARASEVTDVASTFTFTATQSEIYVGFYVSAGTFANDILIIKNMMIRETSAPSAYTPYCAIPYTRTGRVDLGTLTWVKSSNSVFTSSSLMGLVKATTTTTSYPNFRCNRFGVATVGQIMHSYSENIISADSTGLLLIYVSDTYYEETELADFVASLSGIYLEYETADPIYLRSTCQSVASVLGAQNVHSTITSTGTNRYIYFNNDGSFAAVSSDQKAITTIAAHKYFVCLVGKDLPEALYASRTYFRTQDTYSTSDSIYMSADRTVDCVVAHFDASITSASHFVMLNTTGTTPADTFTVSYAAIIDLTANGMADLTAEQAYDALKGKLTILASGKSAERTADALRNDTGILTRNVGSVDLGTLNWEYQSSSNRFRVHYDIGAKLVGYSVVPNIACAKYVTGSNRQLDDTTNDKMVSITDSTSYFYILVRDTDYTDATTFKTAMSGVCINYELATPTTEQRGTVWLPKPITECSDAGGLPLWGGCGDIGTKPWITLGTPQNVSVSGTTASFDEVTGATSYELFVDGTSIGTYTPS